MWVLSIFVVLGVVWTVVLLIVAGNAGQEVPYKDVMGRAYALRLKLTYLLLTVAVVAFVVSMGWVPYEGARVSALGEPRVTVQATGQQWAWTMSRTEVPRGVPVAFEVSSKDVNHGFGLYSPEGKLLTQVQVMPGYPNRLIYTFREAGRYSIKCLEFCGVAHHNMMTTLDVK